MANKRAITKRHSSLGACAALGILLALGLAGCDDDGRIAVGIDGPATDRTRDNPPASDPDAAPAPFQDYVSINYAGTGNWLCHPDKDADDDICRRDIRATAVEADGTSRQLEIPGSATAEPPVDCFYLYPTTSLDPSANADFDPDIQERQVTELQFARYRNVCRTFAPVYRQSTLSLLIADTIAGTLADGAGAALDPLAGLLGPLDTLGERIFGELTPDQARAQARERAYADVLDAFKTYIADHNDGRGFILVGHSQGSQLLIPLLREVIASQPYLSERLIAAHIPGANIAVPRGADVGATFERFPGCRRPTQTGCVVAYSAFREGDPFLDNGPVFGVTQDEDTLALCTNPARLAGGSSTLRAVLPFEYPPAFRALIIPQDSFGPYALPATNLAVATPYYAVPNQITGTCRVNDNDVSYLEIEIEADPTDPRADNYPGEFIGGQGWGLHLVDVSLVMDDLVTLAATQARSWAALRRERADGSTD